MISLLNAKIRHGLSVAAIDDIRKIFNLSDFPSQYIATKTLKRLTGLEEKRVDCCIKSCIAFIGNFANEEYCPCGEPRYMNAVDGGPRKPRKSFIYLPIIPRLLLQYSDPERARIFKNYPASVLQDNPDVDDFWNGSLYQEFRSQGFFADAHELAFVFSTDGVNVVRQKTFDVWPLLLINLNLPPEIRVKKENMLLCGFIPGPRNPKDLNSFLRPLIDEFKVLSSSHHI
jgi:hypothetical protein